MEKLQKIQNEINGGKNCYNDFAHFTYRNAEELFNKLKPLLEKYNCNIKVNNDIMNVGDKQVIKTTIIFIDLDNNYEQSASAFAGVDWEKKGLDFSQACGSAQSYATKYALCSLLLLSDSKLDSDSMPPKERTQQPKQQAPVQQYQQQPKKPYSSNNNIDFNEIDNATTKEQLTDLYNRIQLITNQKVKGIAFDKLQKRKVALGFGQPIQQPVMQPAYQQPVMNAGYGYNAEIGYN